MSIIKNILISFLAIMIFSCSNSPENKELTGIDKGALDSVPVSTGNVVSISPDIATVRSTIALRVADNALNNSNIQWYLNGIKVDSSQSTRFSSSEFRKGDIVHSIVSAGGKEYPSNEITIKNTPPVIMKAGLIPAAPKVSSVLTVDVHAEDDDNDAITYKYSWSHNSEFAGEESFLETTLKRGDTIEVVITPFDGENDGRSSRLKSEVLNSLPVYSAGQPEFEGNIYKYQIIVTDPDNDSFTYELLKGPDGMKIDPASGLITWDIAPGHEGLYEIEVSVNDNHGGEIIIPYIANIGFK